MPVKPLSFKGDKKSKKRKHHESTSVATEKIAGSLPSVAVDHAEDDSWVTPPAPSVVNGPVILVLPTSPPTCLAADSNGSVFASQIENMVERDPKTAEPHDIRQVWVASRVAGMGESEIGFKGSHGGYLSCDSYGILGARREARGKDEGFILEANPDASGRTTWKVRTAATKNHSKVEDHRYLFATSEVTAGKKATRKDDDDGDGDAGIQADAGGDEDDVGDGKAKKVSITLRGDGDAAGDSVSIILRMQARFLPQTQEAKDASRAKEKVSRKELETAAGRSLNDEEARKLKRAKREGTYYEEILNLRAKGKHDKFA